MKHYINQGKAYSYAYDEAGNISKITNPDGSYVEYTYDSLNQLIGEQYSNPVILSEAKDPVSGVTYQYDTRGNILSKTYSLDNTVVDTINYGYTDTKWKDRLTSYNGVTITNDAIGNPLSWYDGATMTWQRGRQLASYSKNGVTTTYAYDDTGLRTSKKVGNVTTTYSVVDGTLRRMSDGTNTLQFVYGNGLSSVIFNGTEYWYVFNAQGDVIGLIDASGNYVVEYTYDSWGKPLSKTGTLADTLGTLNPFRYRGYIYDEETGFYYVSSRYYDPAVGRFLNADDESVLNAGYEHPMQYNMYAYCWNNPVNMVDYVGKWPVWIDSNEGSIWSDIGNAFLNVAVVSATIAAVAIIAVGTGGVGAIVLAAGGTAALASSATTAVIAVGTVAAYTAAASVVGIGLTAAADSVVYMATRSNYYNNPKSKGTPRSNQAQNKQFNDVVKKLKLTKKQQRLLHNEISGKGYDYQEILEIASDMFGILG